MITCFFENNNKALNGLRHITVNALVIHDNQMLLGKRGSVGGLKMVEWGKWGLLGGFMDRDETLVQTVEREIWEESGCTVDMITLFRIVDNPYRPKEDRQNVDIIFIAQLVEQKSNKNDEVIELKWHSLDNLPPQEDFAFDHYDNIILYKKYMKKKFPLPLLG